MMLCKAEDCDAPIEAGRDFCVEHWRALPPHLQQAIAGARGSLTRSTAVLRAVHRLADMEREGV